MICPAIARSLTLLALAGLPLFAGTLDFRVRDSRTGYAVTASVKYALAENGWTSLTSGRTESSGRFRRDLVNGRYLIEVAADGYETLRTHRVVKSDNLPGDIMLVPAEEPYEYREDRVRGLLQADRTLLMGFVLDAETLDPLLGVRVTARASGSITSTDRWGFYSMSVPAKETSTSTTDLTFELPGYGAVTHRNVLLPPGQNAGGRVEMERGGTPKEFDKMHKFAARP